MAVQQSEAQSQQASGRSRPSASAQRDRRTGRTASIALAAFRNAAERMAARIGERQIPKVLAQRDRVHRELRAIPQRIQKLANQADLVLELIDDYRAGHYREISWRSLAIAAGALLYSVSPGDVVPDFIPMLGNIDDAVVLSFAMRLLRSDLERYCRFKGYARDAYFD